MMERVDWTQTEVDPLIPVHRPYIWMSLGDQDSHVTYFNSAVAVARAKTRYDWHYSYYSGQIMVRNSAIMEMFIGSKYSRA